jgi:hypothetical protein
MRWAALPVALAVLLPVAGCGDGGDSSSGDSSSGDSSSGDSESILRSVRAYFVFDKSPDFNAYCRSFVSVHDQHTFRQGSPEELAPDAAATQKSCLRAAEEAAQRYPNRPNHTGWPDTQIGEVHDARKKDRATVTLSYRLGGRTVPAKALVARIEHGDWRVLRAGYD